MICHIFPGMNLYYPNPAQLLTTTAEELDDLDEAVELC